VRRLDLSSDVRSQDRVCSQRASATWRTANAASMTASVRYGPAAVGEMPDPVIDVCVLRRATAATRRADRD